jgi:hypothetical protein
MKIEPKFRTIIDKCATLHISQVPAAIWDDIKDWEPKDQVYVLLLLISRIQF